MHRLRLRQRPDFPFTDGAQFGLGAEIGISTQKKLHARGPMALRKSPHTNGLLKERTDEIGRLMVTLIIITNR